MRVPSEQTEMTTGLIPMDAVFDASRVVATLNGTTKADVLAELVDAIRSPKKMPTKVAADICNRLRVRERMGTTALGRGCAIPHIKWSGTQRFLGAIGYCPEGIDFDSLDGGPTWAVFLVVGPEDRPAEYVNLMTRLARIIQKNEFVRFLASCHSPQDFVDLLVEMDQ